MALAVAAIASDSASSSGAAAPLSLGAAAAAFVAGVLSMRRCAHRDGDQAGRQLAALAVAGSVLVGLIAMSLPSPESRPRPPKARAGDVRLLCGTPRPRPPA